MSKSYDTAVRSQHEVLPQYRNQKKSGAFSNSYLRAVTALSIIVVICALPGSAWAFGIAQDQGPGPGPSQEPPVIQDPHGPTVPYISGRLGSPAPPNKRLVTDGLCLTCNTRKCEGHQENEEDGKQIVYSDLDQHACGSAGFADVPYNVWIEGRYRRTKYSVSTETLSNKSVSLGVDRLITSDFLLGFMVVGENEISETAVTGIEEDGDGFLFGPYIAYRITPSLTLDARFLAGSSNHDVITAGVQTGRYRRSSYFAAVRLTSVKESGEWSLIPSIEFASSREKDKAYNDTLRGIVPSATSTNNYATAALIAAYNGWTNAGGSITPYIGADLSSSFDRSGGAFGSIRAGFTSAFKNGARINFDIAYGAIGLSQVDDYQASAIFEVSF